MSIFKTVTILVVGVGALLATNPLLKARSRGLARMEAAEVAKAVKVLRGSYTMQPGTGGPRLGLKFLDDHRVAMYGDGKIWGPMCTYTISGRQVDVKHACGVWNLEIKGNTLLHKERGTTFTPD